MVDPRWSAVGKYSSVAYNAMWAMNLSIMPLGSISRHKLDVVRCSKIQIKTWRMQNLLLYAIFHYSNFGFIPKFACSAICLNSALLTMDFFNGLMLPKC